MKHRGHRVTCWPRFCVECWGVVTLRTEPQSQKLNNTQCTHVIQWNYHVHTVHISGYESNLETHPATLSMSPSRASTPGVSLRSLLPPHHRNPRPNSVFFSGAFPWRPAVKDLKELGHFGHRICKATRGMIFQSFNMIQYDSKWFNVIIWFNPANMIHMILN